MPDSQEHTIVTPEGVRDGDPLALSGLTARRGRAVLAYADRVAAPGRSADAAAAAFAWFRRAVVEATDPYAVDPERTLLRGARYTAAAHAPRVLPLRARLRGGAAPCELVPELLAARAERELSDADISRLTRHLGRCAPCRAAEERFRLGERAYRDAPDVPPPAPAAEAIMAALLAAAPRPAAETPAPPAPSPEPPPAPEPIPQDPPPPDDVPEEPLPHPIPPVTPPAVDVAAIDREPFVPEPAPGEVRAARIEQVETIAATAPAWAHAEPGHLDAAPATLLAEPASAAYHTTDVRQPTYEFDALPAEAFDLAPQPAARRSAWAMLAVGALVLVVLAALIVVGIAVADVMQS